MSKQSDADRIRAMAQTLRSTREGNPQLLLDIRSTQVTGTCGWPRLTPMDMRAGA